MLYLHKDLPIARTLRTRGVAVSEAEATPMSGMRRILLLNLMPLKEQTELDFADILAATGIDVQLILMKIAHQTYKHTPQSHMTAFYHDFEELQLQKFDGLIVTGTPVELLPFEHVRYWRQLCGILDWATAHTASVLNICWGAQAALYHRYGIKKQVLADKTFGIYRQKIIAPSDSLLAGFGDDLNMPQSHNTEVRRADIEACPQLKLLAASDEAGVGIVKSRTTNEIFVTGHLEYPAMRLDEEYRRDLSRHMRIHPPRNYYKGDEQSNTPVFSWRDDARLFYYNWLSTYAVLQNKG